VEEGTIAPSDLGLFRYVEDVQEAWEIIKDFHDDLGPKLTPYPIRPTEAISGLSER
jgi:hypothetical protein